MEHLHLPLSKGMVAIIDSHRQDLAQYRWTTCVGFGTCYAKRVDKQGNYLALHRVVLGYTGPLDVHHINGNGLDNREANLQIVDRTMNHFNKVTSTNIYTRTTADGAKRFDARVSLYGVQYNLGSFRSYWAAELIVKINKHRVNNGLSIVVIKRANRWAPLKRQYFDWRPQELG